MFITGVSIANTEVTNRLVALYAGGATPKLMTGIAHKESTYQQFRQQSLYEHPGLWPNSSYDGGSHVGLMQMPITKSAAWDWLSNTQSGVSLFKEKLAIAKSIENSIRASHTNLAALGTVQRENMALVLYGPYAGGTNQGKQYYIPSCNGTVVGANCNGGKWQWKVNTAGNPGGVGYANSVRSQIQ